MPSRKHPCASPKSVQLLTNQKQGKMLNPRERRKAYDIQALCQVSCLDLFTPSQTGGRMQRERVPRRDPVIHVPAKRRKKHVEFSA